MWVEFERSRHAALLRKGTRVQLRRLRFVHFVGAKNEAEIRGTSGIPPFRYHVRYPLPSRWWPKHEWVGVWQITHVCEEDLAPPAQQRASGIR